MRLTVARQNPPNMLTWSPKETYSLECQVGALFLRPQPRKYPNTIRCTDIQTVIQ